MSRLGLGQRILLVFTGLVLVGSAALILWSGSRLQTATLDFFQQDLLNRVITAASSIGIGREEGEGGLPAATLQSRLAGLSEDTGYDFLLVDGSGRLISPQFAPEYLDTLPASLFQSAVQNGSGVYSAPDALGQERAWAVVPLLKEEGNPGFLIVSAPTAPADAEVRGQWLTLLAIALPIVALVALASVWLARSIIRPLHQLEESALRMADGHLDTRITVHSSHEINALAAAFNQMAAQLEALIGQQRSFVSNAAHELRRPLMAVRLRLEAVESGDLTPEQQQAYLKELDAETARMAELVTSLLTLARLDEAQARAPLEAYDAAALIQDTARHWRIQAQRAGLTFQATISPDLPNPALPAESLRMILDNLLSNAVKYTAQGRVTLDAQADAAALRLTVQDSGEGFTAEEQSRLFERFFRATRERPSAVEGTGLGLAIVAALVQQAGGAVQASSPGPGKGATFRVTLPIAQTKTL